MILLQKNILGQIRKKENIFEILILVFALAIRLAAIFVMPYRKNPNAYEYGDIANNILEGRGYSGGAWFIAGIKSIPEYGPTAFVAPGYTYTLAFLRMVFSENEFLALFLIQAIISGLLTILTIRIARIVFNERTAIISSLIVIFNFGFIYSTKIVGPLVFHIFFLATIVLYLLKMTKNHRIDHSIKVILKDCIFGVFVGVALLFEPVILSFLLLSSIYLILIIVRKNPAFIKRMLTIWVFCILTISPWLIRNYLVFDEFVFIKSSTGLNLWIGNNPNATGAHSLLTGEHITTTMDKKIIDEMRGKNEVECDRILLTNALEYIKNNPGVFVEQSLVKAFNFWWPIDKPPFSYRDSRRYEGALPFWRRFIYSLIFFPGLVGIVLSLYNRKDVSIFLLIFTSYTISYSFFFVIPTRFRMPTDLYMIVAEGYLLGYLYNKIYLKVKNIT
jgi:4-amino-4-deoxy-L-arabinose transferase-like glycosyltransferase